MSFISAQAVIEDGTGLNNSNAYVSAADARQYLNLQDRTTGLTELTDIQIAGYLVQGTIYIDKEFTFKGTKKKETQALEFPRDGQNAVPDNVKYATIEAAALIQKNSIFHDPGSKETFITEQKVGPITTKYSESSKEGPLQNSEQVNRLDYIRVLLKDFIAAAGGLTDDDGGPITNFVRG